MAAVQAPVLERREAILSAAADLFSRRGYHATSMRDLADHIGIRAASLYGHFGSKEDLLFEIVTRAASEFIGALEDVVSSPSVPEEKLRAAMRAHIRVLSRNLEGAWVFHHEWRALAPPRREEIAALRDRYEELWDDLLRELRPVGWRYARLLALSAANWTYVWYDPDGSLSPEAVADHFTDLLLDGIRGIGSGNGMRGARERDEKRDTRGARR